MRPGNESVASARLRRFFSRSPRQGRRPAPDTVLQPIIRHFVLGRADPPADRDAGEMDRFRVAGNERMPPKESLAFRQPAVGTARWQPDDPGDISRGQPDTILHPAGPMGIIAAAASFAIEQPAAHIGEIGSRGILLILKLDQAAAAAPVTEAFPLGITHFPQGLTAPERNILSGHCAIVLTRHARLPLRLPRIPAPKCSIARFPFTLWLSRHSLEPPFRLKQSPHGWAAPSCRHWDLARGNFARSLPRQRARQLEGVVAPVFPRPA